MGRNRILKHQESKINLLFFILLWCNFIFFFEWNEEIVVHVGSKVKKRSRPWNGAWNWRAWSTMPTKYWKFAKVSLFPFFNFIPLNARDFCSKFCRIESTCIMIVAKTIPTSLVYEWIVCGMLCSFLISTGRETHADSRISDRGNLSWKSFQEEVKINGVC